MNFRNLDSLFFTAITLLSGLDYSFYQNKYLLLATFNILWVQYHGLVVDVSFDWKPVESLEEQGDMGEFGKVEHQAGSSVLDKLQGFDGTNMEPSQQRVAVVQTGEGKCLD